MERIKLFTANPTPRKKLFSTPEPTPEPEQKQEIREYICRDCGQVLQSCASPTAITCPNCGGNRLNIRIFPKHDSKEYVEVIAESPNAGVENTKYEESLKEFSGKTLGKEEFEKTFSGAEVEEMLERGYASVSEDGSMYEVSDSAYELQRLFSKLTISVTKTMELDPAIMEGARTMEEKENIIEGLRDRVPEKQILILRKAHNLPMNPRVFSEGCDDQWVKDSGIINDLGLEYDGKEFGIEEFVSMLRSQYDDAPANIIDILVKEGVIEVNGNKVIVHKK